MKKEIIRQQFEPEFRIENSKGELVSVKYRQFTITEKNFIEEKWLDKEENIIENLDNMGHYVVEEIWKHYKDDIWVSNLGYATRLKNKPAECKEKDGYFYFSFKEASQAIKKEIRCNIIDLNNKAGNDMEVDLWLLKYDKIYHIVADLFLVKNSDIKYNVHHIDNNSYNNSITNLFLVEGSLHKNSHWLHPFSFKKTENIE